MASQPGMHRPPNSTALGKVLLAFLPSEQREEILSLLTFERATPRTMDMGARCVAAPVLRRKRESGGRYQRFRTYHLDEPGPRSSICPGDKKSCSNNFGASGPFELRFSGGQTARTLQSQAKETAGDGVCQSGGSICQRIKHSVPSRRRLESGYFNSAVGAGVGATKEGKMAPNFS